MTIFNGERLDWTNATLEWFLRADPPTQGRE